MTHQNSRKTVPSQGMRGRDLLAGDPVPPDPVAPWSRTVEGVPEDLQPTGDLPVLEAGETAPSADTFQSSIRDPGKQLDSLSADRGDNFSEPEFPILNDQARRNAAIGTEILSAGPTSVRRASLAEIHSSRDRVSRISRFQILLERGGVTLAWPREIPHQIGAGRERIPSSGDTQPGSV